MNRSTLIQFVFEYLPGIRTLLTYRLADLPDDLRAGLTVAQNFLYQLDAGLSLGGHVPHPRLAHALDTMFVLHAEHEMNCSTAAARHLASSGVDVYTAVGGAVGALYGPLHGGANEAVLKMLGRIGSPAHIPAFLEAVKARKEILFGFGHRRGLPASQSQRTTLTPAPRLGSTRTLIPGRRAFAEWQRRYSLSSVATR
jgi:hypothetical protein